MYTFYLATAARAGIDGFTRGQPTIRSTVEVRVRVVEPVRIVEAERIDITLPRGKGMGIAPGVVSELADSLTVVHTLNCSV